MTKNLAECRVCHLLIRSESYGTTVCQVCTEKLIRQAETQERLDRIHERRYTQVRDYQS